MVRVTRGPEQGAITSIVHLEALWAGQFGLEPDSAVLWAMAPPCAAALAGGHWDYDVTPVFRREQDVRSHLWLGPGPAHLRRLLSMELEGPFLSPRKLDAPLAVGSNTVATQLRFLGLAQHLANQDNIQEAMKDANPAEPAKGMPTGWTMRRARISFDMSCMLWRREWYVANAPLARYLAFDASPQMGIEVFATVERCILWADLEANAHQGIKPAVEERRLPLVTLGAMRMGLAEKLQAHVHQVALEYGPGAAAVKVANADVRVCLSDMGTELGIGDSPDVVGQCLDGHSANLNSRGFLYPRAFTVPGPQHIVDGVLGGSVALLEFWPVWSAGAKGVLQWCHPKMRRELLQ